MSRKKFDQSELQWTDSDYLCLFCYSPLYYEIKSRKEVCANKRCLIGRHGSKFIKYDPTILAIQKLKNDYDEAVKKYFTFSKQFFLKRLYEIRTRTILNYFENKGMNLNHILAIDYLLTSISNNESWGTSEDIKLCDDVIQGVITRYDEQKFLEEIQLEIFLLDEKEQPYAMKYYDVIMNELRKELGMVDKTRYGPEDVNTFYFVDKEAKVGKPTGPFDFTTIFKNNFRIVISANHLFKFGHFIYKIHEYPAKTADLAILFSLLSSCEPGKTCSITRDGLKIIYDGVMKANRLQGNFDEFLEIYTTGNKFAPVLIFDSSHYYYDYFTMLIFMFYIFSINKTVEGPQTESGFQSLNNQRKESARAFEKVIREKFRQDGYVVYPDEGDTLEPQFDGEKHEFDCVAIDDSNKIIVLADGKYGDFSPSSISGETMVKQIVLDDHDGSLLHAQDQHKRRRFFIKNFDNMPCNVKQFWNYKIISIVITKYTPMIKKHLTTRLMSYSEFLKTDFRDY